MIGAPAISMNCFGVSPPNLLPLPAAGMIAMFITVVGGWWLAPEWLVAQLPTTQAPTTNHFLNQPKAPALGWVLAAGRGNRPSRRALLASGPRRVRKSFCQPWSAGRWSRPRSE